MDYLFNYQIAQPLSGSVAISAYGTNVHLFNRGFQNRFDLFELSIPQEARDDLAIHEKKDCRHGTHRVMLSNVLSLVDIDLHER